MAKSSFSHSVLVFVFFSIFIFTWSSLSTSLGCIDIERQALVHFKHSLNDPYNRLSSWVGSDCCNWTGIRCDNQTGHVSMLDLRNSFNLTSYDNLDDPVYAKSRLVGREVSLSLLDLKHVKYLDLSWNDFSGIQIPNFFGSFQELEYLNLSSSLFSGVVPHHLGNLSSLKSLDLSDFNLLGYLHFGVQLRVDSLHWVSRLSNLRYLNMNYANLSQASHFLREVDLFPRLLKLYLFNCQLTRNFLSISFDNLTSLVVLDLFANDFEGPLPTYLGNMTSLEVLDLGGNQFDGRIQNDLSQLCHLRYLNLQENYLEGDFTQLFANSSCFRNHRLKTLDLSDNRLSGNLPHWLSQLKNLEFLSLAGNSFRGPIPLFLWELSPVLYLERNHFNGTIPKSLKQVPSIEALDLSQNQLRGSLPNWLGQLKNLEYLRLDGNYFHGEVPPSLWRVSHLLDTLSLSNNSFQGVISDVQLSNLSNLKELDLSSNSFTVKTRSDWVPPFQLEQIRLSSCKIGPDFPLWLGTQKNLNFVDISNASIIDTIPEWFFFSCQFTASSLIIDLSFNKIYGKVPQFKSVLCPLYLDFSHNNFEDFQRFPSNVSILDLSYNKLSGPLPKDFGEAVPKMQSLDLSYNQLSGPLPQDFSEVVPKLQPPYLQHLGEEVPKLTFLDLSHNFINGSIPHSFRKLKFLSALDLSSNNLSGTIIPSPFASRDLSVLDVSNNTLSGFIPNSLGDLVQLQWLHLSQNKFHGSIPHSLQKCSELIMLDLGQNNFSANIPTWIGEKLSNLKFLSLRLNKFSGVLPSQLCHLVDIQLIDIAQNNISGSIPRCFGNFDRMKGRGIENTSWYNEHVDKILVVVQGRESVYTKTLPLVTGLDLSKNELVGRIPEELTALSAVRSLNLSNNQLQGRIPETIGNMKLLESLDLSENQFSGRIPESLSYLYSLNYLNLSYNNLSGEIPSGNQLQTLNDPSIYYGNPELCGAPLEKKCFKNAVSLPTDYLQTSKNDDFDLGWFYIGMVSGHVLGFWGVCSVLFFNKTWRTRFFKILNVWKIGCW